MKNAGADLHERTCLYNSTYKHQQGILTSCCEDVNYLLATYATNNISPRQSIGQSGRIYCANNNSASLPYLARLALSLANLQPGKATPELGQSKPERKKTRTRNACNIMNVESAWSFGNLIDRFSNETLTLQKFLAISEQLGAVCNQP